jgi:putative SOS response-associated peptidase YedK
VAAERELVTVQWGLVPHWAKFARGQAIARAEEIAEKPMFMDAFQKRRCLIPADGYVRKSGRDGWPHVFEFPDQRLFAFAGVWDSGMNVESAAIITVASNEKNWRRMPLVLLPNDYTAWLDPNTESPALARLLQAAVQGIVAVRAECRNFNSDATPDVDQSTKSIW